MDLQNIIKSPGTFLVDVRTPGEFEEGSAHGAVNIPLDRVQVEADQFKGKEHIVVFCRSGNRSAQAKYVLEKMGFTNVTNGGTWEDVAMMQE
jgi:phage shock protein E